MQKTFVNDFQERLIIAEEGLLIANEEGLSLILRTQIGEGFRCSQEACASAAAKGWFGLPTDAGIGRNCFGPSAAPCWPSSSVRL